MTVAQIFTKIGTFIENRQMFMMLNCNCAKLANFENFKACLGRPFSRGRSVVAVFVGTVSCMRHYRNYRSSG